MARSSFRQDAVEPVLAVLRGNSSRGRKATFENADGGSVHCIACAACVITNKRAYAMALCDYIEPFYDRKCRHFTLGYVLPEKFLEDWIKHSA